MNDEELKELWRGQQIDPAPLPDAAQMAEMKQRMKGLNRTLFWRDFRESIAAVFVIIFFTVYLSKPTTDLARLGCVILILSGVLVIIYPLWRKARVRKASPHASMMESLECELKKVEVEIALLRSIIWWYLLPSFVGVIVFFFGVSASPSQTILYALFVLALDAFIYWINQVAVAKRLLPVKRELESLLHFDGNARPPEIPRKTIMAKLIMLIGAGLLVAGAIGYFLDRAAEAPASISYSDPNAQMLEKIRVKQKFPALAAAVVIDGKIVMTNAVGFRKQGGAETVSVDDKFHIGSVTKSMTATVAAMLVEQGKISWTNTIGESFPELGDQLNADYRAVTLEQLLSHRGGAPGQAPADLWMKAWGAGGMPSEQRLEFVKGLLTRAPEAKPGTKHIYSNQGYAIAGVMLEKATGKAWEDLMRSMLFEPVGMTSAGFGAPAAPGETNQPWGHKKGLFTGFEPVPPGPQADNPAAIGPAGTVHCSVADLAKYAAFHMAGERGGSKLLKAESFKKLHESAGDDYALGWMVLKREWAGDRALMHNGSNTMFYVVVWMAPNLNSAVIVATNVGADSAFGGCDEAASNLIRQYFPK